MALQVGSKVKTSIGNRNPEGLARSIIERRTAGGIGEIISERLEDQTDTKIWMVAHSGRRDEMAAYFSHELEEVGLGKPLTKEEEEELRWWAARQAVERGMEMLKNSKVEIEKLRAQLESKIAERASLIASVKGAAIGLDSKGQKAPVGLPSWSRAVDNAV